MTGTDKIRATELFQQCGIEGLPARVFSPSSRPTVATIANVFNTNDHLVVRAAAQDERRNLPRLAGATHAEAAEWIARLPDELSIVIQPFDEVLFSVELVLYDCALFAEIVPGIWELDCQAEPVVVIIEPGRTSVRSVVAPQPSLFFSLAVGRIRQAAQVADWQINALTAWIEKHHAGLSRLTDSTCMPVGVKAHYATCYGLSPQNIRTTGLPSDASMRQTSRTPNDVIRIDSPDAPVPKRTPVLLDVAVAREAATAIDGLIDRLQLADVPAVYLRSGLLSHLYCATSPSP